MSKIPARVKVKAYIELIKVTGPKTTLFWAVFTSTGILLTTPRNFLRIDSLTTVLAALLTAFGIYSLNDIFDLEIDRINYPMRPIPSGRVTKREVGVLSTILFILGLSLAYSVNIYVFLWDLLFAILGLIYSTPPIRLRKTILSNFVIGAGCFSTVMCGASVSIPTARAGFAAGVLLTFVTSIGALKDISDIEGDSAAGIKTLPILIGKRKTIQIATGGVFVLMALLLLGYFWFSFNTLYLLTSIIATAISLKGTYLFFKSISEPSLLEKAIKTMSFSLFLTCIAFALSAL